MLFNTPIYLILLFSTFLFLNYTRYKFATLIIASFLFFIVTGYRDVSVFYVALFLNWLLQIVSFNKKTKLFLAFVLNLGIVFVFKYYRYIFFGFSTETHSFVDLSLPVGISFYSFQLLAYHIDSYKNNNYFTNNFKIFFIFIGFFPQLIAGPIMRANKLIPQINNLIRKNFLRKKIILYGLLIILIGLIKKIIFADSLGIIVDDIFIKDPENSLIAWCGAFLFAFQIYFDFSGYSDIAIGSAYILGIRLTRNFITPYLSCNPREFWRRWHISLSTWIRDYIYIPLGGSKENIIFSFLILIFSMGMAGIWHGANITFFYWGIFWGFYIFIYRFFSFYFDKYTKIFWLINFAIILTLWVIFRSHDINYAFNYIYTMYNIFNYENFIYIKSITIQNLFLYIIIFGIIFGFHYFESKFDNIKTLILLKKRNNIYFISLIITTIFLITLMPSQIDSPFIYFRF